MPSDKKRRIEYLTKYLFLKHITQILTIVLCFSGIVILTGRYILEQNLINLAENLVSVSKDTTEFNREIKGINENMVLINALQSIFVPWSKAAFDIARATPKGIKWSSWDFNSIAPDDKIKLTGVSFSREDILEFAENLKRIEWVRAVNLPVDELVKIGEEPFRIEMNFDRKNL